MKTLTVDLGHHSYPILLESGLLDSTGVLCREHGIGRRVAVITDSNVAGLYYERVERSLIGEGFEIERIELRPGEPSKSLAETEKILDRLLGLRFERTSGIIALGGGVVGDLAGFAAATLLRGVNYIQVPTSLIAQTDSSIGGKVGVNHTLGKNLIGAFYHPRLVLIDPLVLKTLHQREWIAGMGEVIKYGIIRDLPLFELLEERLDEFLSFADMALIERVLLRCCEIKRDVVVADEKEGGLRRILNFGHTLGHALEAATGYEEILHGEGVLLGMIAAAKISQAVEGLPESEFDRITALIRRVTPFTYRLRNIDADTMLENMSRDKKVKDGKVHFVLIQGIGETTFRADVPAEEIKNAYAYLQGLFSE